MEKKIKKVAIRKGCVGCLMARNPICLVYMGNRCVDRSWFAYKEYCPVYEAGYWLITWKRR